MTATTIMIVAIAAAVVSLVIAAAFYAGWLLRSLRHLDRGDD